MMPRSEKANTPNFGPTVIGWRIDLKRIPRHNLSHRNCRGKQLPKRSDHRKETHRRLQVGLGGTQRRQAAPAHQLRRDDFEEMLLFRISNS
jgi:hypothetical protein